MSVTQLATAVGLRLLGLLSLKRDDGRDFSVRICSSWCSAAKSDVFIVTLIHGAGDREPIGYEAFVGSDVVGLLDAACRAVESRAAERVRGAG